MRARMQRLSAREREVVQMLVNGNLDLNVQMATKLGISVDDVEAHCARSMEKLQVKALGDLVQILLLAR